MPKSDCGCVFNDSYLSIWLSISSRNHIFYTVDICLHTYDCIIGKGDQDEAQMADNRPGSVLRTDRVSGGEGGNSGKDSDEGAGCPALFRQNLQYRILLGGRGMDLR